MKLRNWNEVRRKYRSDERLAELDAAAEAEVLELNLREMRRMLGKTQAEVAKRAKIGQGDISKAERREDHLLSTLRRIVESLGGRIEVMAKFGDMTVRLRGV